MFHLSILWSLMLCIHHHPKERAIRECSESAPGSVLKLELMLLKPASLPRRQAKLHDIVCKLHISSMPESSQLNHKVKEHWNN